MIARTLLLTVFVLAGCAAPIFDKEAALLDACCIDPTPKNWHAVPFEAKPRSTSITFCTMR